MRTSLHIRSGRGRKKTKHHQTTFVSHFHKAFSCSEWHCKSRQWLPPVHSSSVKKSLVLLTELSGNWYIKLVHTRIRDGAIASLIFLSFPHACFVVFFFLHTALLLWGIYTKSRSFQEQRQCIQAGIITWKQPGQNIHVALNGNLGWAWFVGVFFLHILNACEDCSNERCWSGGDWSPVLISLTGNSNAMCPGPDPHDWLQGSHSLLSTGPPRWESHHRGQVMSLVWWPGRGCVSTGYVHLFPSGDSHV